MVNREALIRRVGGDLDLLQEMFRILEQDRPRMMERIRMALDAEDSEELEAAAHALVGAVSNFSAADAVQRARELESGAREGRISDCWEILGDLSEMLPGVEREVSEVLAGGVNV